MELLQIKMLNTAVERILNREMASLGLTYAQTTVMGFLLENRRKEVCQRDIEYNLGLSHPTISSILSRMEEGGLVCSEVRSADRRYKKIVLTEKALSLSKQIRKKYKSFESKLFLGISAEQRDDFDKAVKILLDNAQRICVAL